MNINYEEFAMVLQKAIDNDKNAIYEIIKMFEPLIKKYSNINYKFDKDCKSEIEERLLTAILKFKIK